MDEIIEDYKKSGYREWTLGGSLVFKKPNTTVSNAEPKS
jgi:hypothetical protein